MKDSEKVEILSEALRVVTAILPQRKPFAAKGSGEDLQRLCNLASSIASDALEEILPRDREAQEKPE